MSEEPSITNVFEEEVCQHCGAVLDLAQAMQSERSILRRKLARASTSQTEDPAALAATREADPSVAC